MILHKPLKYFSMKFLSLLFCMAFIAACSSGNTMSNKEYYFDENGKQISKTAFFQKRGSTDFARWSYMKKDSGKVTRLNVPHYQTYFSSYPQLMDKIEKLTNKQFEKNTIFIIHYEYLGDLCGPSNNNKWKKWEINNRKNHYDKKLKKIKSDHENMVFLAFFEKGIELKNEPKSEEEYLY